MEARIQTAPISKTALWTGRTISGLVVLFLLFDSITKLLKVDAVLKAAAQLGFSARQIVGIGLLLLICTIIYVIPRTSVLGAVLLTGYLGGATAIQVHVGNPMFETLFPVIFGVLVWAGLFMRDEMLRSLIPVRKQNA
jgi:DoxX-like family